jgi:hypothetical protein
MRMGCFLPLVMAVTLAGCHTTASTSTIQPTVAPTEPAIIEMRSTAPPSPDRNRMQEAKDFLTLAQRALKRAQDRLDWLNGRSH